MGRSRVAVVIPALNEARTIMTIVEAVRVHGLPIVVDDGSIDNTAKLASQAGAEVVRHDRNLGYDVALNSGFKRAADLDCEVIITVDADGQHDPSLVGKFIDAIDQGADVVIGSRNHRQRAAENMFAWYTRTLYGIRDPLCGMKAYRRQVYDRLGLFDSYGSIGTELMLFAVRNHYQIRQIDFEVRNREGQSRFGRTLSSNYKIVRSLLIAVLSPKPHGTANHSGWPSKP